MTNVKFSRKELEKHFNLNEKTIEKISLFGTPLEKADDKEIEIEVFPNRPDLISLQGFARAFKAFIGKDTGLKIYPINKPEKNYSVKVDKSVKPIRPHTVCAIVKNINFNDEKIKEIIDLQEKLHITIGRNRKKVAIGIYPLEKIKLPITYTARDPNLIKFIPLEASREMNAKQILQRTPAGIKYGNLIKDFKKFPVFLDANSSILSIPPIINSNETGKITEKTKEIFIECSGSDLNILNKTLNIIVTTLAEMGGKIYQMNIIDSPKMKTPDLNPDKIKISLENANKLLGLELKEKDLNPLLQKMGYEYQNQIVKVPAWRTDIIHEVDIFEDIAIAYGYDKLIPEIPNISSIGYESKENKIKSKITEILTGLNAIEILTYHLIKPEEAKKLRIQNPIELLDSKTEYKILRPNLLIPSLRILSENIDVEYPQKIFEIGTIFEKESQEETGIKEKDNLILAITPSNFTTIKQHLDYLMNTLRIKYEIKENTHNGLIDGRTGDIIINKKSIGYLGELHPASLKKWGLKMPLGVIEISLEEIYKILDNQ
ncbi:MAG: phenylalanine--tRNA ligase subunit beta [Candidatus Pacearchaeota archaeon]|nr:phenylalanine--tRNA ligase subunit beta [Candidatus Pacearchaeota archaeon]